MSARTQIIQANVVVVGTIAPRQVTKIWSTKQSSQTLSNFTLLQFWAPFAFSTSFTSWPLSSATQSDLPSSRDPFSSTGCQSCSLSRPAPPSTTAFSTWIGDISRSKTVHSAATRRLTWSAWRYRRFWPGLLFTCSVRNLSRLFTLCIPW